MTEKVGEKVAPAAPTPTWGTGQVIAKISDVFKPMKEVIQYKKGLKIIVYGQADTMKTGFCLSCPPPVYIIDTELGAPPVFRHFPGKDIQWCDATFLDPTQDTQVAEDALTKFESILMLLKNVKTGTIAIDSATDVWDWVQGWVQKVGKKAKGQLLQFEWPKAYARWRQIVLRMFIKPVTVVFTAQPQEIWEDKQGTGRFRPRIMKASPHRFDLIIHMQRWDKVHPTTRVRTVRYVSEILKCRWKKGYRPQIDEMTYDKLVTKLKEDLGVQVW